MVNKQWVVLSLVSQQVMYWLLWYVSAFYSLSLVVVAFFPVEHFPAQEKWLTVYGGFGVMLMVVMNGLSFAAMSTIGAKPYVSPAPRAQRRWYIGTMTLSLPVAVVMVCLREVAALENDWRIVVHNVLLSYWMVMLITGSYMYNHFIDACVLKIMHAHLSSHEVDKEKVSDDA